MSIKITNGETKTKTGYTLEFINIHGVAIDFVSIVNKWKEQVPEGIYTIEVKHKNDRTDFTPPSTGSVEG